MMQASFIPAELPRGLLEGLRLPPALMILGTSSDAGKSLISAGLCRLFFRRGLNVAPFKAQNMALNSAVTDDGGEIGRAQALQARACGLRPDVRMNPVLLKPRSQTGSQVIVLGKAREFCRVHEYERLKPELFHDVCNAYASLARGRDLMILEGAGSPAEINLKRGDIVNTNMAREARARMILVGDIDRGGVFASLAGTLALMEDWERELLDGFVINRFRGDASLLPPALDYVGRLTGKPFLGVVPWVDGLMLPEEDSVAYRAGRILRRGAGDEYLAADDTLDVALVDIPYLSNLSDIDPLLAEPWVRVRMVSRPEELGHPDLIIMPGSRCTAAALRSLRSNGLEKLIKEEARREGGGGYSRYLRRNADDGNLCCRSRRAGRFPGHVEEAFGLLPLETTLGEHKVLRRAAAEDLVLGLPLTVYEIHHGKTETTASLSSPVEERNGGAMLRIWTLNPEGEAHGWMLNRGKGHGLLWGTYGHGLFDDDVWRNAFLNDLRRRRGKKEREVCLCSPENSLDRLADTLERHLDLEQLCTMLRLSF